MWRFTVALLVSTLAVIDAQARRRPVPLSLKLNDDHLGESLKDFRSRHKNARCHRRPSGEAEESKLRAAWLTWVDCGFENSTVMGMETVQGNQPFGTFATFHDKKLVEISFTLADQTIAAILPTLIRKLGEPSRILLNEIDELQSVTWVRWRETLTVEFLLLPPVATDRQFLRIKRGVPARAVQVRMTDVDSFQGASKR
jgi:hypothetical protein